MSSVQNGSSLNSFLIEPSTDARCFCVPFFTVLLTNALTLLHYCTLYTSSAIVLSKHLKAGSTPEC